MKVTIYQTMDVEAEADVSVNDVLAEFSHRFAEAEQAGDVLHRSAYLPLIDFATRLMARVPSKVITACSDSQRAEVVKRLYSEVYRWYPVDVSAEPAPVPRPGVTDEGSTQKGKS